MTPRSRGAVVAVLIQVAAALSAATAWAAGAASGLPTDRAVAPAALPYLTPTAQSLAATSHARDGTNGDGYVTTLDYLHRDPFGPLASPYLYRDREGRYVLMQAAGPGAITRVWLTAIGRHGRGDPSGFGRIEIFIDGERRPRVDLPAARMFSGRVAPFVTPLCGGPVVSGGGDYCDVRMPFRNGAKVVTTGRADYWQIDYESYPRGTRVSAFTRSDLATRAAARMLSRAGRDPGILPRGPIHSGTVTLASGRARDLFRAHGPGTLRDIELSFDHPTDSSLQGLWLEARWDGHRTPDLAAPVADLFLSGAGERAPATALLAGYLPDRHRGYLRFPMPYARSAAVRLVNRGAGPVRLSWRVQQSARRYAGVGTTTGELHATYSSVTAATRGRDVRLLDAQGSGRVVGLSLTEEGRYSPGLPTFLEGDLRAYIDGSQTPQIYTTGTEDTFGGGFYYTHGPFALPTHGETTLEDAPRGARASQYRLLLNDSWSFRDGIRLGIEHGAGNSTPVLLRSVTFWYGAPRSQLRRTDRLEIGMVRSEQGHRYRASQGSRYRLTGFYEGDRDGNVSPTGEDFPAGAQPPRRGADPQHESITGWGRKHRPGGMVKFTLKLSPRNVGVVLRRRLDQAGFQQGAEVTVDGSQVGTWLSPGVNDRKRFADSDFYIPAAITAGRHSISVGLRILRPDAPAPARAQIGWRDFRYDALSIMSGGRR